MFENITTFYNNHPNYFFIILFAIIGIVAFLVMYYLPKKSSDETFDACVNNNCDRNTFDETQQPIPKISDYIL